MLNRIHNGVEYTTMQFGYVWFSCSIPPNGQHHDKLSSLKGGLLPDPEYVITCRTHSWMVYFMENANLKWMMTGGPPSSGHPHSVRTYLDFKWFQCHFAEKSENSPWSCESYSSSCEFSWNSVSAARLNEWPHWDDSPANCNRLPRLVPNHSQNAGTVVAKSCTSWKSLSNPMFFFTISTKVEQDFATIYSTSVVSDTPSFDS